MKGKKTKEQFVADARKVHGNKYDYSKVEYKGCHVEVEIICPKHGSFLQTPINHLKGRGCIKCHNEERFAHQQERDNAVRQYCKEHKIKLIEIPYTEFDNIENILTKRLKHL